MTNSPGVLPPPSGTPLGAPSPLLPPAAPSGPTLPASGPLLPSRPAALRPPAATSLLTPAPPTTPSTVGPARRRSGLRRTIGWIFVAWIALALAFGVRAVLHDEQATDVQPAQTLPAASFPVVDDGVVAVVPAPGGVIVDGRVTFVLPGTPSRQTQDMSGQGMPGATSTIYAVTTAAGITQVVTIDMKQSMIEYAPSMAAAFANAAVDSDATVGTQLEIPVKLGRAFQYDVTTSGGNLIRERILVADSVIVVVMGGSLVDGAETPESLQAWASVTVDGAAAN